MQRYRTRGLVLCFLANCIFQAPFHSTNQMHYLLPRRGSLIFASNFRLHPSKGFSNRNSLSIKNMSTSSSASFVKEQVASDTTGEQIEKLSGIEDLYGGVIVEMKERMDSGLFIQKLRDSLSMWRKQGKKGIWIKLPIELVNLVEPIVKEGFRYHHAEPNYLMLVYWLPDGPDTIPVNASHRVGIGAFVVNENREVLVVQEKSGWFKGTGLWKLPTGVVNEGEHICTAAVREVKEETGIDVEFLEILSFRQSHQSFFSKSDLFFVCMLRPCSLDIQKQDSEVAAAQWMPIEEYVNQPYNQENPLFKYVAEICKAKSEGNYTGFSALSTSTASGKDAYLYFNNQDFNKL